MKSVTVVQTEHRAIYPQPLASFLQGAQPVLQAVGGFVVVTHELLDASLAEKGLVSGDSLARLVELAEQPVADRKRHLPGKKIVSSPMHQLSQRATFQEPWQSVLADGLGDIGSHNIEGNCGLANELGKVRRDSIQGRLLLDEFPVRARLVRKDIEGFEDGCIPPYRPLASNDFRTFRLDLFAPDPKIGVDLHLLDKGPCDMREADLEHDILGVPANQFSLE